MTEDAVTTIEHDLPYWIAFSRVPTVGRVRIGLLEERFGSLKAAWEASTSELGSSGLTPAVVSAIEQVRRVVEPESELEQVRNANVSVLTWHDSEYPRLFRTIDDPPPILYVKGTLQPDDESRVTVVGTRNATPYGREVAREVSGGLAESGVSVVSGLARGIDGIAHDAALRTGGRTIAVIGSGLDVVYPPEHRPLFDRIVESGAVLSEYPLGTKPEARHFPRRNRLLSGLSAATVVIEGGLKSGARLTVEFALEQNREVLCVPGSIHSPASELTNWLIQQGAKLVMRVEDVLEELQIGGAPRQQPLPGISADTEEEARLLDVLTQEPQHIDELSRSTGMSITQASGTLAVMEIKGSVLQVGRMNYIRARAASVR